MTRIGVLLRWAVAAALLVALASLVDLGGIASRLGAVNVGLAVPAIAGLVAVHTIAAFSWRRLTASLAGIRLGARSSLRRYYEAQAFGTVTPANLGADVYRVVASGATADRARLMGPIIVQRLTSIVALLTLGFLGAVVLPIDGKPPYLVAMAVTGALLVAGTLAVLAAPARWQLGRGLIRRLGFEAIGTSTGGRLGSAVRDGVGLGLVFHASSLALGLLLVLAVDASIADRAVAVLGALAVARLSLAVPLSPNGLGLQEGLLAVLFVQLGLAPETALAAALLNRMAFLAVAGIGSIALLAGHRGVAVARARPT
jgi:uncharacterized membrane protein YbhN (UPF0104 family)